jgi:hypothetical protein
MSSTITLFHTGSEDFNDYMNATHLVLPEEVITIYRQQLYQIQEALKRNEWIIAFQLIDSLDEYVTMSTITRPRCNLPEEKT